MQVVSIQTSGKGRALPRPLMLSSVRAGFPSPADDYIEKAVDLNDLLVRHPVATFYLRARGDSMEGAGIKDGAILIVDRSLTAADGDVVVAVVDGNLTVKRLRKDGKEYRLEAANARYMPIPLTDDDMIWGVVTDAINPMRKQR